MFPTPTWIHVYSNGSSLDPRLGEGASISYPLFSHYCYAAQTTTNFCGEILSKFIVQLYKMYYTK